MQSAVVEEEIDEVVEVVGVEQLHVTEDRRIQHAGNEDLFTLIRRGRSHDRFGHHLAVVNVRVVAHVDHEIAQQSDLLTLLHFLHRFQHRVGVGGKLVALGNRGHLALTHELSQFVPETELHVHRPEGVAAGDRAVDLGRQVAHHLGLLVEAHRHDFIEGGLRQSHAGGTWGCHGDGLPHLQVGEPDQGQLVFGAEEFEPCGDGRHGIGGLGLRKNLTSLVEREHPEPSRMRLTVTLCFVFGRILGCF